MGVRIIIPLLVFCVLLIFVIPSPSYAQVLFTTVESNNYLIVGQKMDGQALTGGSGKEIGSNNAPVPATGQNGCTPTLVGTVPALPFAGDGMLGIDVLTVSTGPTFDGNIAITEGTFSLAGYGVYGDIGIRVPTTPAGAADVGSSLSFFNSTDYPNSLTFVGGVAFCPLVINPVPDIGGGLIPTAGVFSEPLLMAALTTELAAAKTAIDGAPPTSTLDFSGVDGVLKTHTIIDISPGLSIIDICTTAPCSGTQTKEFKLQDINLVINGTENSFVIFRLQDESIMDIVNSNILVSDKGIGLGNVMFYSGKSSDAFKYSNTVLNGIAFWALETDSSKLDVSNGMQGCTQLIAGEVLLSNVRISRCSFNLVPIGGSLIPIDTTALLLASVQTSLAWIFPFLLSAVWIISVILAGIGIGIVIVRKLSFPTNHSRHNAS